MCITSGPQSLQGMLAVSCSPFRASPLPLENLWRAHLHPCSQWCPYPYVFSVHPFLAAVTFFKHVWTEALCGWLKFWCGAWGAHWLQSQLETALITRHSCGMPLCRAPLQPLDTETPTFVPKTSWVLSLGIACCAPARQTFTEWIPKTSQGSSGST